MKIFARNRALIQIPVYCALIRRHLYMDLQRIDGVDFHLI